jgi:uncharacterized protein YjhX (UPF0386 family)
MHLFGVAQTLQDHQTQTDNHRNALEAKIVKDTNILKQEFVYHSNRLSQQIIRKIRETKALYTRDGKPFRIYYRLLE